MKFLNTVVKPLKFSLENSNMTIPNLKAIIKTALKEDIGVEDITSKALIDPNIKVQADIIIKSKGIACGVPVVREVFKAINPRLTFRPLLNDGAIINKPTIIAHVYGRAQDILTAERVALNFLSLLSGIATTTYAFVKAIKPYRANILDTRKTIPLLRSLQRYAVKCGKGVNHRFDLSSMALIKDNHRILTTKENSLIDAVNSIKKKYPSKKVVLEVDDLNEYAVALQSKADIILLDNMPLADLRKAVYLRKASKSKVLLEVSGGVNLKNVKQIAATGVERISIGALTHHLNALDVSLDIVYRA